MSNGRNGLGLNLHHNQVQDQSSNPISETARRLLWPPNALLNSRRTRNRAATASAVKPAAEKAVKPLKIGDQHVKNEDNFEEVKENQ